MNKYIFANDSLIKTENINKNIILVRLGYDAITAINTKNGIVVIDAGISYSLTNKYRMIIEKKFNNKKFIYLLATHWHSDHIGGNCIFKDADIICQENYNLEVSSQNRNIEKLKSSLLKIIDGYKNELKSLDSNSIDWINAKCQQIRYQYAYDDVLNIRPFCNPKIVFHDTLTIHTGDIKFELIYFGKAHSASDIIIYIPELKMLFSGDLFSKYGRKQFDTKYKRDLKTWTFVKNWLSSRKANIENIISGHGEKLSISDFESFIQSCNENWK